MSLSKAPITSESLQDPKVRQHYSACTGAFFINLDVANYCNGADANNALDFSQAVFEFARGLHSTLSIGRLSAIPSA